MDDSGTKALMIIASIAAGLLVIGFAIFVVMFSTNKGTELTNQISEKMDAVAESEYTQYDGEEIAGSMVVNFIKTVESGSDDVYVLVKTLANSGGVYYVCDGNNTRLDSAAERNLIKNARTKTHGDYIAPSEYFYGEVIRNANNAIVGMQFTQQ